ncbi:hypothetical protein OROGR_012200 [Orobanche gracilis]
MARKNQSQQSSEEETLSDSVRQIQTDLADLRVTTETVRRLENEITEVRTNTVSKQQHDELVAMVADLRSMCMAAHEMIAKQHQQRSMDRPPPQHNVHSPSSSQNFNASYDTSSVASIKPPKVQLPAFDGSNPLDWISKARNFFTLYQIPNEQRLTMVSFYLQGPASGWYNWMSNNNQLTTWDCFVRDLLKRFGASSYENMQATLFKLRQTSSVMEYQLRFETVCNLVTGLSSEAQMNCFISGLKPEIQAELAVLKPTSATQAVDQAKLVETKLFATTSSLSYHTLPAPVPLSQPSRQQLPIRHLTQAEMQVRRQKGLCFNCDEKFSPGHKCKTPQFLALLVDESEFQTSFPNFRGGCGILSEESRVWRGGTQLDDSRVSNGGEQLLSPFTSDLEASIRADQPMGLADKAIFQGEDIDTTQLATGSSISTRHVRMKSAPSRASDFRA